jgi:hypothetical protein
MAFNVNDIVTSINKDGVLKPSKFEVNFLGDARKGLVELGTIRCIAAMIPGVTINTTDFKLHGGMPVLRVPVSRTYNDLRLTFLTTKDSEDRYQFERWMRSIQNFGTNTMAYYDDICSDILIDVFDETRSGSATTNQTTLGGATVSGTVVDPHRSYSVNVIRAIPISIDDVDLSWADTDKLMEYSVTFSYEQLQLFALDSEHAPMI